MRTYVDFRSLITSDQVVSSIKDSKWLLFHQNQKEFYIQCLFQIHAFGGHEQKYSGNPSRNLPWTT
jgi:hypothetical protein